MAGLAMGIGEIPQRASALRDGLRQHLLDGAVQQGCARLADAGRFRGGTDAGQKQHLGRVNITHAHHRLAAQQYLLDGRLPALEHLMECQRLKSFTERLHPQTAQQLVRHGVAFTAGIHHRAEAAWVVQAQGAQAGHHFKVVMLAGCGQAHAKAHAAGHAQMHQQQATVQVNQQVFAAPTHGQHALAVQLLRPATERPAQRFADGNGLNAGTGNAVGKAQAGDFNFGQFWHGIKDKGAKIAAQDIRKRAEKKGPAQDKGKARLDRFNYHGLMKKTLGLVFGCLWLAAPLVLAQTATPEAAEPSGLAEAMAAQAAAPSSLLDSALFYQLLLGEFSLQEGEAAAGFALMLDAARKTGNPQLYQRATEIALQSRSGDAALQAARAWTQEQPASREANRYLLQILIALNRIADTVEPLKTEIRLAPDAERAMALTAVPRAYARVSDKKLAATVVETALADDLKHPATASAAWTTVGRMRLAAGDNPGAMLAAQRGQAADASAEGPALLALELMDAKQPEAEGLFRKYLEGNTKVRPEIRMAYARTLLELQRYADATAQLQIVTLEKPDFPEGWLVLGSLQLQGNQHAQAQASLERYVALAEQQTPQDEAKPGLAQAYLSLSQLAEKRKDYAAAESWLNKIENPADLVRAQTRRASILASQGRLEEGRQLIRQLPERSDDDARLKLNAEISLLRDFKQYQLAHDMLAQALAKTPDEPDLLYDQSMMAEKLGSLGEMERLLRRIIQLKPDYHQAYNALGYSLADRNIRLPEARELIRKALEYAPSDPFIQDSLGWVEFRMGNKAEALQIFEAAYKAKPDAEIAAHFGELLWSLGQRERAVALWKEGLMINPDNETLIETLKRLRVKL